MQELSIALSIHIIDCIWTSHLVITCYYLTQLLTTGFRNNKVNQNNYSTLCYDPHCDALCMHSLLFNVYFFISSVYIL